MVTTIILPVSRKDFLDQVFARLEFLKCDKENTNLLVYVDGDHPLYQKARNLTVNSKFKEKLCIYRSNGLASVSSISRRRQRISDIHNEIRAEIKNCDYVFLLEDDTLFGADTLKRLYKTMYHYQYAGFISGVQLGRWGYLHIGAWIVDDIYNTNEVTSVALGEGVKKVDAAGLYCCLIKAENYLKHVFKPYEGILGPDVDFGLALRKQGLENYINFDVKCDHLTKKDKISFVSHKSSIIRVKLERDETHRFGWKNSIV